MSTALRAALVKWSSLDVASVPNLGGKVLYLHSNRYTLLKLQGKLGFRGDNRYEFGEKFLQMFCLRYFLNRWEDVTRGMYPYSSVIIEDPPLGSTYHRELTDFLNVCNIQNVFMVSTGAVHLYSKPLWDVLGMEIISLPSNPS